MSYRKAKLLLQQKKMQEQNIDSTKQKKQEEEQQQQTYVPPKKANNMFEAFGGDDSDEKQEQQKPQKKQVKKQNDNKKVVQGEAKKKKNKKKKKKQKNDQKQQKQQEEQDIQKVFKQMGMQYKGSKEQQKKQLTDWQTILEINDSKFNYEKQLRRHFGNTGALNEQKAEDPDMDKRQQKLQKHLRKAMKKSVLSPGVKDFFMIRQKFEVDRDEDKIRFIPTKKYDHYQVEYESIRNSNDINALFNFMQTHPQHVDSIYAVGQFLRLQGNYRDADNLIQRVLYIYEMAASYDINQFIKADLIKKQIIYDVYSTSLFMSLFKFMDILGKKGCYRAALEYNKFLLKINIDDPTACILCIDFNSISAKCNDYLLKFVNGFSRYVGDQKSSLYLLPNFTYSTSLAKYYLQNPEKSEKQLVVEQANIGSLLKFTDQDWKKALTLPSDGSFTQQSAKTLILRAILVYPKLIVEIANKNEYAKQFLNYPAFEGNQKKTFKQILAHQFWTIVPTSYSYNFLRLETINDSSGLDKVLQVYVERSKILWKSNQIMLWVKGAMGFVLNKVDLKQFDYQEYLEKLCIEQGGGMPIPFQLRRYSNISKANFSDRVDRIDLANIQDNQRQQAPRNQNRMRLQGNPVTMFLNSLLPWVNLPNNEGNDDPDMPDIHQDND